MGYQMTPDNSVDYIQYFTTNLYNPTGPSQLGLLGEEGFVRGRFNNLQVSPRTGVSVGYEARLYLPTKPAQRKAGLITAMRNYVNFTKVVSPKATVLVQALAATYAYERGASSASGTFTANPLVEPRLYVVPMFQLTPKTTLNFPVMFWATMHHNVPGADKSNRTTFSAAIWPEVYYMVAPKTQIGVSYYSGNFVDGFQTALTQGTFQAILQQAI